MGQVEDLDLFIRIVDAGSVTKAAQELNIAKSAVSRRLAGLEARLDTLLIDRGPGRWALTDRGAALLERARAVVGEVAALEADFQNPRLALQGPLRLSLPRDFGLGCLMEPLQDFMRAYPGIELRLSFEDRMVDLTHENVDAALRITGRELGDVQATQLGRSGAQICASPAYLAGAPPLTTPADLSAHTWLTYGSEALATLPMGGKLMELRARHASSSGLFLREAAIAGLGLAAIPNFLSQEALASGQLVPVLSNYPLPELGIYLCRASGARPNRRVSVFADYLSKALEGKNW